LGRQTTTSADYVCTTSERLHETTNFVACRAPLQPSFWHPMPSIHAQRRSCNPTGSVAVFVLCTKTIKNYKNYRLLDERSVVPASLDVISRRRRMTSQRRRTDLMIRRRRLLIPLFGPWSRRGLNPIKPVYDPYWPDGRLNLAASAFNQLGQYTSSPG